MSKRYNEILATAGDIAAQEARYSVEEWIDAAVAAGCESEIEKLMAAALIVTPIKFRGTIYQSMGLWNAVSTHQWEERAPELYKTLFLKRGPMIFMQQRVLRYRADFVVAVIHDQTEEVIPVIVECDGHEFHERTKDQAEHDKRRDREMAAAGYRVFRFTGREIWRDPFACADEVMGFLSAELAKRETSND